MVKPQKLAVMGGDLGGTKFAFKVFPVAHGRILEAPLFTGELATTRGAENLKKTVADAYHSAASALPQYTIVGVGIGSPGRPLTNMNGAFVVAPHSATNLESTPGELDNVDLQPILQGTIPVPVTVNNDGIVQMQAMLVRLLQQESKTRFFGKKIGYIGMGTGLGGGFAAVDKKGAVAVHTDGHIDEILLHMTEDMPYLRRLNDQLPPEHKFHFDASQDLLIAEDILCGSAFTKMTGLHGEDITDAASAEQVRPALELMGRALAELITKLHDGNFKKLDPAADWSSEDLKKIEGTSTFLMGGGMANNRYLMDIIERTAQEKLRAQGITDVALVAVANRETTLAAANIVPQTLLQPTANRQR